MYRNYYLIWTLLVLTFSSCTEKAIHHYQLEGHIEGLSNQQIVLERLSPNALKPIDTVMLDAEGNFKMKGVLEAPSFCRVTVNSRLGWIIFLDNKHYQGSFNLHSPEYELVGSPETKIIQDMIGKQRAFIGQANQLNGAIQEAYQKQDEETLNALEQKRSDLLKANIDYFKEYVDTSKSIVRLFAYNFINPESDLEYFEERLAIEEKAFKGHYFVKDYQNIVNKIKFLSEGSIAPDLAFNNPNGELLKLSDLRGKVVLLDFWASWCGPCRKENPHVVSLYHQYKNKGFDIYSVSFDKEQNAWLQAISADGLVWSNHVSDLQGWKSEAGKIYNVKSIPTTYLLDREGRIVGKNLRGEALAQKLKELF